MLYLEKHPHSPGRVVAKSEVITNPEGVGGPRGLVLVSRNRKQRSPLTGNGVTVAQGVAGQELLLASKLAASEETASVKWKLAPRGWLSVAQSRPP